MTVACKFNSILTISHASHNQIISNVITIYINHEDADSFLVPAQRTISQERETHGKNTLAMAIDQPRSEFPLIAENDWFYDW